MQKTPADILLNHPDIIAIREVMGNGNREQIIHNLIADNLRLRAEVVKLGGKP
jgi:hypothetical protein